uniref:Uncharacterized protein n=1 Tax=Anguilla anguilla TaxID=7936 RepID=A0A0E9V153_ANGAN
MYLFSRKSDNYQLSQIPLLWMYDLCL